MIGLSSKYGSGAVSDRVVKANSDLGTKSTE